MATSPHSFLRSMAMTASLVSMPMASQLGRTIARQILPSIRSALPEDTLPSLTQIMIVGQAESKALTITALVLALATAGVAVKLNRLSNTNPWQPTGQILLTAIGFIVSQLMIATTLVAALLPFLDLTHHQNN